MSEPASLSPPTLPLGSWTAWRSVVGLGALGLIFFVVDALAVRGSLRLGHHPPFGAVATLAGAGMVPTALAAYIGYMLQRSKDAADVYRARANVVANLAWTLIFSTGFVLLATDYDPKVARTPGVLLGDAALLAFCAWRTFTWVRWLRAAAKRDGVGLFA